jgi:hypothetical protein
MKIKKKIIFLITIRADIRHCGKKSLKSFQKRKSMCNKYLIFEQFIKMTKMHKASDRFDKIINLIDIVSQNMVNKIDKEGCVSMNATLIRPQGHKAEHRQDNRLIIHQWKL